MVQEVRCARGKAVLKDAVTEVYAFPLLTCPFTPMRAFPLLLFTRPILPMVHVSFCVTMIIPIFAYRSRFSNTLLTLKIAC